MKAIILAGGKGTRLKPFTNAIPKPLVPIGDMPILEVVLRQLKHYGVTDVVIAVNHLARLIEAFFGDGSQLGLNITYSMEDKMLGTAGPLRLVEIREDDFLVMNGDLLTTIDFADFFAAHRKAGSGATIATFRKDVKIDLGVLKMEGDNFVDYIEKPTYSFMVSMGIYALSKAALDFIPADTKYDMPELIQAMKEAGKQVRCYSGDYDWLDIGRIEDYETAVSLFEKSRSSYLPDLT
jgi:NDP-sugar pyrophosphorylase family protein